MTIKIEMTVWDNDTTVTEKAEILTTCENLLTKTYNQMINPPTMVKVTNRWYAGWTAEIEWRGDWAELLKAYNKKLCRFHYWNRDDEPLQMEWDIMEGA